MFKKFLITLTIIICGLTSYAAGLSQNRAVVKDGYNFWLYEPKGSANAKPLIVFLHGASLCGSNLDRVRHYGTIDAIEKGRELDAFVIAPQNPGGSWNPRRVMNIIEYVEAHYNVDANRVYVIGMSLGGYGTLDVVATYPDKIAAAMAFCGGATVRNLSGLNEVPLWIVHGMADRAVKISESDRVVAAMKAASPTGKTPRLVYDRVPGMNHGGPARLLYLAASYDWLLSHSLADEGRPVAPAFAINSAAMSAAYDGLDHSAGYHYSKKKSRHHAKKKSRRRR